MCLTFKGCPTFYIKGLKKRYETVVTKRAERESVNVEHTTGVTKRFRANTDTV